MFIALWLILCVIAASLLLLPLALWRSEIFRRYSGSRVVECPENHKRATVSIDRRHASETGLDGCPEVRLCDCTRWPERASCEQGCRLQAVEAGPVMPGEVKTTTKQIYHLPIFLAAFAAWCVGAIWHSQGAFRATWIDAVGLTRAEVKQIVWWLSPHLLTFGMWLLFAYAVAWLLALGHRKGVLQGMLVSVLVCGAMIAACAFALARLPHALLAIEAGYTALATLLVGAIVGGLYNKRVLPQ